MLLSRTKIKLCIYLRTHEGESVFVELESEDIEKAAMLKANVTEEQIHPIGLMRVEFIQRQKKNGLNYRFDSVRPLYLAER